MRLLKTIIVFIEITGAAAIAVAVYMFSTWPIPIHRAAEMSTNEWWSSGASTLIVMTTVAFLVGLIVYVTNAMVDRHNGAWRGRFASITALVVVTLISMSALVGVIIFLLRRPAL